MTQAGINERYPLVFPPPFLVLMLHRITLYSSAIVSRCSMATGIRYEPGIERCYPPMMSSFSGASGSSCPLRFHSANQRLDTCSPPMADIGACSGVGYCDAHIEHRPSMTVQHDVIAICIIQQSFVLRLVYLKATKVRAIATALWTSPAQKCTGLVLLFDIAVGYEYYMFKEQRCG